jgi:endonuclease YncB( thermonuclease family)
MIVEHHERPSSSAATTSSQARVTQVIDGDTLVVASGAHLRLIGIDTPERDQCGYQPAADALRAMVEGRKVTLVNPASVQDEDRYGRLLRYVDLAGRDTGHDLLKRGLAVARYDSRDGYDHHPRQSKYRAADRAVASVCD